jgi:hypothetical protein
MTRAAGFLTELLTELKPGRDDVSILTARLGYYSALLAREIWMPPGFESDGASVPRVPIIYELYGNRAHREGFLHDWLFRIDSVPGVSWTVANAVFLEAMESRGKALGVRYPMYWGVCIGGYFSYHKRLTSASL